MDSKWLIVTQISETTFPDVTDEDSITEYQNAVRALTKDLKKAAVTMGRDELRYLVDSYYRMQNDRIRSEGQTRSLSRDTKPHDVIEWYGQQNRFLENQLKGAMAEYVNHHPVGQWLKSICGVGPVTSAGLLAHVDLNPWKCRRTNMKEVACSPSDPCTDNCKVESLDYVGQLWSYAGLNPNSKWEKKTKRPWNAALKTLCYKIGESFVKQQGRESDIYGRLFAERKEGEWKHNLEGENSEYATEKAKSVGKSTIAYKWYSGELDPSWVRMRLKSGKPWPQSPKSYKTAAKGKGVPMIPPAHVHARARRWTVKLFLSHFFEVMYKVENGGTAPAEPFVLSMDNHNRKIPVPNEERVFGNWAEFR